MRVCERLDVRGQRFGRRVVRRRALRVARAARRVRHCGCAGWCVPRRRGAGGHHGIDDLDRVVATELGFRSRSCRRHVALDALARVVAPGAWRHADGAGAVHDFLLVLVHARPAVWWRRRSDVVARAAQVARVARIDDELGVELLSHAPLVRPSSCGVWHAVQVCRTGLPGSGFGPPSRCDSRPSGTGGSCRGARIRDRTGLEVDQRAGVASSLPLGYWAEPPSWPLVCHTYRAVVLPVGLSQPPWWPPSAYGAQPASGC